MRLLHAAFFLEYDHKITQLHQLPSCHSPWVSLSDFAFTGKKTPTTPSPLPTNLHHQGGSMIMAQRDNPHVSHSPREREILISPETQPKYIYWVIAVGRPLSLAQRSWVVIPALLLII